MQQDSGSHGMRPLDARGARQQRRDWKRYWRYRVPHPTRWWSGALLMMFVVALALIVFLPAEGHHTLQLVGRLSRHVESLGFSYTKAFTLIEFTSNIALFVPFGVLFPLALGSVRNVTLFFTVVVGAAASIGIELTQLVIPGRVSAESDVIANTCGTAIGVLLIVLWRGFRRIPAFPGT